MSAFWQLMRLAHVGSVLVRTASRATSASPLSLCRALTTTTTTSSTSSPSASSASDSTSVATPKKRKYKVVKRPRTSDPDAPMRLDKLLSNLGYCSRRLAAKWIRFHNVTVLHPSDDGQSTQVERRPVPSRLYRPSSIRVRGAPLPFLDTSMTLLLHKPPGYTCSHVGEHGSRTIFDLLPETFIRRTPQMHIAGRLDKYATGAVILTQDSYLVHRVISPKQRNKVSKVYNINLKHPLRGDEPERIKSGTLMLNGEKKPCRPGEMVILDESKKSAQITIQEGRYHQIRRMVGALGNLVLNVHRVSVGPLSIDDPPLKEGQWRIVSRDELAPFLVRAPPRVPLQPPPQQQQPLLTASHYDSDSDQELAELNNAIDSSFASPSDTARPKRQPEPAAAATDKKKNATKQQPQQEWLDVSDSELELLDFSNAQIVNTSNIDPDNELLLDADDHEHSSDDNEEDQQEDFYVDFEADKLRAPASSSTTTPSATRPTSHASSKAAAVRDSSNNNDDDDLDLDDLDLEISNAIMRDTNRTQAPEQAASRADAEVDDTLDELEDLDDEEDVELDNELRNFKLPADIELTDDELDLELERKLGGDKGTTDKLFDPTQLSGITDEQLDGMDMQQLQTIMKELEAKVKADMRGSPNAEVDEVELMSNNLIDLDFEDLESPSPSSKTAGNANSRAGKSTPPRQPYQPRRPK